MKRDPTPARSRRRRLTRPAAALTLALLTIIGASLAGVRPASAAGGAPTPSTWFACWVNALTDNCDNPSTDDTDPINVEYYAPGGHALEDVVNSLSAAGWGAVSLCYNGLVRFDAGYGQLYSPTVVMATDTSNNGCGSGQRDHARLWPNSADTVVYIAASIEAPGCGSHCVVSFDQGKQQLVVDLVGHLPQPPLYTAGYTSSPYPDPSWSKNGVGFDAVLSTLVTYSVVDVSGGGAFYTKFQQFGGASGSAGMPTGNWRSVTGGQEQDFTGINEYWSSAGGTREANGGIRDHYVSLGGPSSFLGMPTSDEQNAPGGGRENTFAGQDCGSHSAILWSSGTGAWEMHGCIYNDYLNKSGFGGPAGQFGYPVSDEQEAPGNNGRVNYMSGSPCGSNANPHSGLYFNGATWGVKGCIFAKYRSMGETSSPLGYPTSLEYSTAAGIRQDFQNGYMLWANGVATPYYPGSGGCTNYGGSTMTGPNACEGFYTTSAWFYGGGVGLYGQEIWTYANGSVQDSTAHYSLRGLDTTRAYQLQAYIPNNYSDASHAHYHYCSPGGGCADGYVNQNNYTNQWAGFGAVCTTDGTATVVLADDGGDTYPAVVGADAIRAVRTNLVC
jgi:hypothetical protein